MYTVRTIRDWKSVETNIRKSKSVASFKRNFLKYFLDLQKSFLFIQIILIQICILIIYLSFNLEGTDPSVLIYCYVLPSLDKVY